MGLKRTVNPVKQPVSLSEALAQVALPESERSFDQLLQTLIAASTEIVERCLLRALITQTWRLTLDRFPWEPTGEIVLPRPPLQEVSAITYIDEEGATQTLAEDQYQVAGESEPATIAPAYGEAWPTTRCQREAVQVTYVAGYGAEASSVPFGIREMIKLMVSERFRRRDATSDAAASEIPLGLMWLIEGYQLRVDIESFHLAD